MGYGLTEEQRKFYDENGYLILDVFSEEEMKELSDAYDELFGEKQKDSSFLQTQWDGTWKFHGVGKAENDRVVHSIHNLQLHHQVFSKALFNKKLVDAAAHCVGSPNVILHHTKAHLKPPEKGTAYPPHQDHPYFPYKKHSMIALFMTMDDSGPENGGLIVYPGSHKLGPLKPVQFNSAVDNGREIYHLNPEDFPIEKGLKVNLKRGQVVFFSYLTIHASFPNNSNKARRMYLVQMAAAEDEPQKDIHINPCHGLVLRGKNIERDANIHNRFVRDG